MPRNAPSIQDDVAALLGRANEGDQQAWNAIVDRFTNLLWSVSRGHRLGRADADVVVQTTWLRLVEHLHEIREPERLTAWLFTTARRESLRVVGLTRREDVGGADDLAANMPDERDGPIDTGLLLDER